MKKNKEIPNNEEFKKIINESKQNEKSYRNKINDINDYQNKENEFKYYKLF